MASNSEQSFSQDLKLSRPKLWQRALTLLIIVAMLAGMVLALTGCPKSKPLPDKPPVVEAPQKEVTVFFTKSRGTRSVTEAVTRPIPESREITPIQFALESLLEGPTPDERRAGFFSEIPHGTELLSVNKKDSKVIVNFSSEFSTGGGSNSIIQRMAEIQNTIIANNRNAQDAGQPLNVQILVNDKPLQALGGEGLEVPQNIAQPIQ